MKIKQKYFSLISMLLIIGYNIPANAVYIINSHSGDTLDYEIYAYEHAPREPILCAKGELIDNHGTSWLSAGNSQKHSDPACGGPTGPRYVQVLFKKASSPFPFRSCLDNYANLLKIPNNAVLVFNGTSCVRQS